MSQHSGARLVNCGPCRLLLPFFLDSPWYPSPPGLQGGGRRICGERRGRLPAAAPKISGGCFKRRTDGSDESKAEGRLSEEEALSYGVRWGLETSCPAPLCLDEWLEGDLRRWPRRGGTVGLRRSLLQSLLLSGRWRSDRLPVFSSFGFVFCPFVHLCVVHCIFLLLQVCFSFTLSFALYTSTLCVFISPAVHSLQSYHPPLGG